MTQNKDKNCLFCNINFQFRYQLRKVKNCPPLELNRICLQKKNKTFIKLILDLLMFINILKRLYSVMQGKIISDRKQCLSYLDQLQIAYKLYEHDPVFNMQEMSEKLKLENSPLIKNLFFADKKPNTFFFVIAEMNTKPEKAFWKKVGTTHNNVRMAKQQNVEAVLKAKKGGVNPFALANDEQHQVKYCIIDQNLFKHEYWAFHPMDNSATVQVKKDLVLKFFQQHKVQIKQLNLTQALEAPQQKKQQTKEVKKQQVNLLGIEAKKNQNFAKWYPDVIIKSGLIDYYDISGCYILRPWSYSIWERIQSYLDVKFKSNGTENAYFPMFVSRSKLEVEKQHVEGFSPEVAWVTKSGKSDLAEPIAIRPTSQTIMYPAFANWIKSHRDLPLRLNQWTNIVRWEFKHPTPFIRTREFLWQEGHTAHATFQEAEVEMFTNLQFYAKAYEELLAVPVVKGIKTQSEKFPGGFKTSTVETWIYENGRAIQAATSHNLGQNFAKMFGIEFEGEKKQKKLVWQTSWGFTTRSIGIMVMQHGDDKGLVLPPRVAKIQAVVIPVPFKGKQEMIDEACKKLEGVLKQSDIRIHYDSRDNYNPGWKYNHWELKGVPVRLELGPKDVEKNQVRCVIRHSGQKIQLSLDGIVQALSQLLEKIQKDMFIKAQNKMNERTKKAQTWQQFMTQLNKKNVVLTPWCEEKHCQEKVKERSGIQTKEGLIDAQNSLTGSAKTLCVPLQHEPIKQNQVCFHCQKQAKVRVYWGRSY